MVDARDGLGQTALLIAANKGHLDVARLLLDHGADVNSKAGAIQSFPLVESCLQGHTDMARLLLSRGANVNATLAPGETTLMCAAVLGNVEYAKVLLEYGADVRIANKKGETAVMSAEKNGHAEMARLLRDVEQGKLSIVRPTTKPESATPATVPPQPSVASESEGLLPLADPRGVQVLGKAPSQYVSEQFGKSWAVVIGIDDYEKAPRLKYAVEDAKSIGRVLKQQGFQVATLYDKQATKAAIERELGDKLVDRVGENDRVVIFYAGHGETKTARGGRTMGYLLPVQGQQDALSETGISMGRIKELADALPSKQVLFLVDVCYGGIAGQQFRSTLPPMTVAYLKQITRERGRQLISAGGPDQQAMESPEWGHSVFTYYLLEGLKGLADLNDDGIIPASELYSYLDSRVFTAAQMKGHTQRPELWSLAAEKGEFVFIPPKQDGAKGASSGGEAKR